MKKIRSISLAMYAILCAPVLCIGAGVYVTRITVDWSDGSQNVILPPLEPPSSTQPAVPSISPATIPVEADAIHVRPESIAADLARIGHDARVLFARGKTYVMPATFKVSHDRVFVGAEGDGPRPVLKFNGDIRVAIAIAGAADDAVIADLDIRSDDAWGQGPIAFEVAGKRVSIRGMWADNVYTYFNVTAAANGVEVRDCENPKSGGVHFYWCYGKGKNVRLIGCTMRRPIIAAFRCNQLDGLQIINCTVIGGRKDGTTSAYSSSSEGRITLQDCNNVLIDGCRLERMEFGTGPLWNIDGYNQTDESVWLAMRTRGVTIRNTEIVDGAVRVGKGTEGMTLTNVKITPPVGKSGVWIDKPTTVNFGGKTYNLPGPINITVEGRKAA